MYHELSLSSYQTVIPSIPCRCHSHGISSTSLDIRHFSVPFKQNPSFYLSPSLPYLLPFMQAVSPNPTFIKLRMDCHLFHVGGNKKKQIRLFIRNEQSSPIVLGT